MPVSDNLSSSTPTEPPKTRLAAASNSPIDSSVARETRTEAKHEASTDSQNLLVPPIRSFTIRGGLNFPSIDSLRSHLSRLHAATDTPLKSQHSTDVRASINKLESLVQEVTDLAERFAIDGQDDKATKELQMNETVSKEPAKKAEERLGITGAATSGSDRVARPPFKNLASLPLFARTPACPVLTLPVSKSAEDIVWSNESGSKEANILTTTYEQPVSSSADCGDTASNKTAISNRQVSIDLDKKGPPHFEIAPRSSSLAKKYPHEAHLNPPIVQVNGVAFQDWDNDHDDDERLKVPLPRVRTGHERHYSSFFGLPSRQVSIDLNHHTALAQHPKIDLRRKFHVDVYNTTTSFDLHETCHHATIARNWPTSRKRFTALIACMNTGCIGLLLGIYAGEVPAIQYAIADFHHYGILGNVLLYLGMALSGSIFWPLPLLHGRKPYVVAAQLLALVLQIPQGLAVDGWRDPSQPVYRCLLLVSRAVSGLALGLADMNIKATLLDCFGASLQSQTSEFDKYEIYDVRRHGGGMGMWLAFVSWSSIGPISIGFMIGASIVDSGISVAWGFWTSFCIVMVVLLINVIMPEVRRSAFRRTISGLTGDAGEFSRVTRGEIKMHLTLTGPY